MEILLIKCFFFYLSYLSQQDVLMLEQQILFKPQHLQLNRAACWFSVSFPLITSTQQSQYHLPKTNPALLLVLNQWYSTGSVSFSDGGILHTHVTHTVSPIIQQMQSLRQKQIYYCLYLLLFSITGIYYCSSCHLYVCAYFIH